MDWCKCSEVLPCTSDSFAKLVEIDRIHFWHEKHGEVLKSKCSWTRYPQVNRCKGGICQEELKDTYKDVERDMAAMREDGRVISVLNKETNK